MAPKHSLTLCLILLALGAAALVFSILQGMGSREEPVVMESVEE